jgi:general secretion pathway protein L
VAILELDEEHTEVLVLRSGEPRFVRSLMRGTRGLPDDAPQLANELRQTLAAWRMQGGEPIEQIYVVGSGRGTPGLEPFFAGELGLTVLDLPTPSFDEFTAEQQAQLPRYAKAIALALSLSRRGVDLNLRQGPIAAQQSFQFLREKTPLLAGLAAAIFVSFGFSIFAEMRALDAERVGLERQLEVATQAHFGKSTSEPVTGNEWLEDAISGKSDDPVPTIDAFDVMVELSERLPPADTLPHDIHEFDYNRGIVKIQGVVPSIDDAHEVAKLMGEHDCFQGVKVARTTRLKQEDKQKYTLEFTVKCGGSTDKKDKKSKDAKAKTPASKGAEGDE